MPPDGGLKLRAEDADDLAVISACLQDALVSVRDLAYDPAARTFMLVANRFRWERTDRDAAAAEARQFERVLCGIAFAEVAGVSYRGFQRTEADRILSLLAIRAAAARGPGTIDLDFAADATIRLSVSEISCTAGDLGEPWPTQWAPGHPPDDPRP